MRLPARGASGGTRLQRGARQMDSPAAAFTDGRRPALVQAARARPDRKPDRCAARLAITLGDVSREHNKGRDSSLCSNDPSRNTAIRSRSTARKSNSISSSSSARVVKTPTQQVDASRAAFARAPRSVREDYVKATPTTPSGTDVNLGGHREIARCVLLSTFVLF